MLKRFVDGLIFGAGFAVAFFLISMILVVWVFPITLGSRYSGSVVDEAPEVESAFPPEIGDAGAYLGSIASFSGDFDHASNKVLAEGPGVIEGRAEVSGKPATGLRLRLALNGGVKSQWAVVGEHGRYSIPVPYGEYRVDGHELDQGSAGHVLAGKIDDLEHSPSRAEFTVSETSKGVGMDFKFVDPVRLNLAKKQFSVSEAVIIDWHPYPGADYYQIQVRESPKPHSYGKYSNSFEWNDKPTVVGTSADLRKLGVELKAGYYYSVDIEALDGESKVISRTAWNRSGYDFRVE